MVLEGSGRQAEVTHSINGSKTIHAEEVSAFTFEDAMQFVGAGELVEA